MQELNQQQWNYFTIFEPSLEDWPDLEKLIKICKAHSVLITLKEEDAEVIGRLESIETPLAFFVMSWPTEDNAPQIRRFLTRRKGNPMVQDIGENTAASAVRRNISGSDILCGTLTYAPYVLMSMDPENRNTRGIMVDTLRQMAREANFTAAFHHVGSRWDVELPEGPDKINETKQAGKLSEKTESNTFYPHRGMLRGVLMGENDLPLSTWTHTVPRSEWFAHTFGTFSQENKCFTSADLYYSAYEGADLLVSPFTYKAW